MAIEGDSLIPEEEAAARRETVERYFNDFLSADPEVNDFLIDDPESGLRSTPSMENLVESIYKVVPFYEDDFGRSSEEWDIAQRELIADMQETLGPGRQLSEMQINGWLSGVTPEQFDAIVDTVAESDLPLYPQSPQERWDETTRRVWGSEE